MEDQPIPLPWEHPDWLEQATAWIQAQAAAQGLQVTGPVEFVHQRPWSMFARVPAAKSTLYFKAPAPVFKFEAALTQALAHWRPDCTIPLLVVDRNRGWLLSADAGVTLRSTGQSVDQIKHWLRVLPFYSEFQIEMTNRVPELLALGLPEKHKAPYRRRSPPGALHPGAGLPGPRTGSGDWRQRPQRAGFCG